MTSLPRRQRVLSIGDDSVYSTVGLPARHKLGPKTRTMNITSVAQAPRLTILSSHRTVPGV
jgi:hypothetical protein